MADPDTAFDNTSWYLLAPMRQAEVLRLLGTLDELFRMWRSRG